MYNILWFWKGSGGITAYAFHIKAFTLHADIIIKIAYTPSHLLILCLYLSISKYFSFESYSNADDKNSYIWFVCLEFFVPLENFSLNWRHHHCRWRAANFDLYSAFMAIEQWGFLSVSHLLWHWASIYNGHPKDPWHSSSHLLPSVWQWSCHYLFLRHKSVAAGIRTPNLPLAGRTL